MKKFVSMMFFFILTCTHAFAAIETSTVKYESGETNLNGYFAYDSAIDEKRPGILVVHEWWGHNDYARKRAQMLAELGYVALAVDMYGDGKEAKHPDDAGKFAGEVMSQMPIAKERFEAALRILKAHKLVDAENVAAIGYCFGGGIVLQMARMGVDLDGVVSFHGSLKTRTPAVSGGVKAKVLVCHGEADTFIKPEDIEAFHREMTEAGVDYRFMSYPGVKHSFTNPKADEVAEKFGLPLGYDQEADAKSWEQMQDFLKEIFRLHA